MLVGNDVVDLRDPENQPQAIHPRFDDRVFTWTERARILAASSPHRMRWALWAAKESAYKVARKVDPRVPFSPRAFTVRLPGGETETDRRFAAEVHHALGTFHVCLEATQEWIHAVAATSGAGLERARWELRSLGREAARCLPGLDAGARVRSLARSALANTLSAVPSHLGIAAAAKRIPRVTWRGQPLTLDLSLSHHGRFVACAWEAPARGARSRSEA